MESNCHDTSPNSSKCRQHSRRRRAHVVITPSPPPPPEPDLTDGLLAFYRFDDDLTDSSGNGYDLTGGVAYTTGLVGQALVGSDTLVSASWEQPLSFSFWYLVGPDRGEDAGMCLVYTAGSDIFVAPRSRSGSNCQISWMSSVVSFSSSDPDEWVHVALTVAPDGSGELYRNGESVGTSSPEEFPPSEGFSVSTNNDYPGVVDLCGVWNRVLTPAEILTLYNGGAGFDPTA